MDIIRLPVRICRCGRYNQISIHLLGMRCGNDIESRTGQDKAFCAQSQYGALWGRDISAQTCKKNNQEDCESFTILARKIFENGKTFVQWRNICHEAMWHHVSKSVLELLIANREIGIPTIKLIFMALGMPLLLRKDLMCELAQCLVYFGLAVFDGDP